MQRHEAEENLRVIRSLMEKATIYRAISAPSALVGGILALGVGIGFPALRHQHNRPGAWFLIAWLVVLGIVAISSAILLQREAHRRNEKFLSVGMKMACRALLPAYFVGAICTAATVAGIFRAGAETIAILPPIWALTHGLGLLATSHFAPPSIARLGWLFLFGGVAALGALKLAPDQLPFPASHLPDYTMAATFGFFHLVYAALTWPRGAAKMTAN